MSLDEKKQEPAQLHERSNQRQRKRAEKCDQGMEFGRSDCIIRS